MLIFANADVAIINAAHQIFLALCLSSLGLHSSSTLKLGVANQLEWKWLMFLASWASAQKFWLTWQHHDKASLFPSPWAEMNLQAICGEQVQVDEWEMNSQMFVTAAQPNLFWLIQLGSGLTGVHCFWFLILSTCCKVTNKFFKQFLNWTGLILFLRSWLVIFTGLCNAPLLFS